VSFRTRLRLAFVAVVLIPVIAFALAVRKTMSDRLTAQYQRRVDALVAVIEEDLSLEGEEIAHKLAMLARFATEDNRLRLAALGSEASRRAYLLDYAGDAMQLAGLSMLQVQDAVGRIVSSGHFRNEYDRLEPELPELLGATLGETALVQARTPEAPFLALARVDSFRLGGRRFTLVGGTSVERSFLAGLAREGDLAISLVYPGGVVTSGGDTPALEAEAGRSEAERASAVGTAPQHVVAELAIPFVDTGRGELVDSRIIVTQQLDELRALHRNIDSWFLVAVAVTVLVAFVLAGWLSSRISRPLVDLAHKTSQIDLDRLDIDFSSTRKDELGALSRLLGAMTERLRAGASRLKEAERRATIGELARQVNHDIKNGLTPIRNVFRHLRQAAHEDASELARVFDERQGTIDSSVTYLENLASNYARLYPRMGRQPCDLNAIVTQVVTNARSAGGVEILVELTDRCVVVNGDPVALRRIIENVVDNAIDSLESGSGTVSVSTEIVDGEADVRVIRLRVTDSGRGMSEEQQAKIFDDFYTTKKDGTGLGLSIVRRLVLDLNGTIRVESELGEGSRFIIELPSAAPATGA